MLTFLLSIFLFFVGNPVGPFAQASSGRTRTAPCISGHCIFTFSGPAGQTLPQYNMGFADYSSSFPAGNFVLTGSNAVHLNGVWAQAGAIYTPSTSDTVQQVFLATVDTGDIRKYLCARASASHGGYCVQLCFGDGTNWARLCLTKDGTEIAESDASTYPEQEDHTIRLVVSGTTTVTINAWVDGTQVLTNITDSSSPLPVGSIAFYAVGNGVNVDDFRFGTLQDF